MRPVGEKGVFRNDEGHRFLAGELSTEAWKQVIHEIATFCPHIYFFGGEPLLRSDCLDLVRYASSRGTVTGLNTNGIFLQGKGEDVIKSCLDYLIVSLDGPPAINNRIRRGKMDVAKAVMGGVKELVHAKDKHQSFYPIIELIMTITEENVTTIADTAKLAKGLDVDLFALSLGIFTTPSLAEESATQFNREFGFEPLFFSGFVRDVSGIDSSVIEEQLVEVKRLWGNQFKQYPPHKVDLSTYFRKPELPLFPKPCRAPWMMMQIFPNGDLVFCSDFADLKAGNITNESALKVWNGPLSRAFRRRILTRGIYPAATRCCDYYLHS